MDDIQETLLDMVAGKVAATRSRIDREGRARQIADDFQRIMGRPVSEEGEWLLREFAKNIEQQSHDQATLITDKAQSYARMQRQQGGRNELRR